MMYCGVDRVKCLRYDWSSKAFFALLLHQRGLTGCLSVASTRSEAHEVMQEAQRAQSIVKFRGSSPHHEKIYRLRAYRRCSLRVYCVNLVGSDQQKQ